ncbi:cysteine hydrolase family protein [Polyangium sorediatum]|uniref:nicotinamidase n=1 Tax=Polyangium sorediatum TaxID=889274 RepID=A0ABT6P3P3_9BACT|nr:isochorismatase family cysteine hydrolase [Polyangium sorediatum]MDI1435231.1 isochorismatase family cysteine hydrolase [Polyangium sorediatum]
MRTIFVDVDVQRDFCEPSGSLYVKGSPTDAMRRLVAYAVAHHIPILGSVDSHAWDAWEFASTSATGPNGEKPNFPEHCVKGTPGWLKVDGTLPPRFRFVPNVASAPIAPIVDEVVRGETQGVYFEKEVYSLFVNPLADPFVKALAERYGEPLSFVVFGVATDYCVRAAALGLAERGYTTTLVTDASAGITEEGVAKALQEMRAAGVKLATSSQVTP